MTNRKLRPSVGWWALIAFGAAVVVMLVGWALARGSTGYGYGAGWMMPGAWGWMGAAMPLMFLGTVLFWAAIILGIVALIGWAVGPSWARPGQPPDAVEIARQRYARGEISREEYERIRDDLTRAS